MKTTLGVACLLLLSVTAAQAIDCAKADGDFDHLICDTPALLAADTAMGAAYGVALKAVGPKMAKNLKAAQIEWNRYRYEDCSADSAGDPARPEAIAQCLLEDTVRRVNFFTGQPESGPGIGESLLPQVAIGADQVFDEYQRFAAPKSAGARAFNKALDAELKDIRIAKTEDHITDYFQMTLAYLSPTLLSANIDKNLEEGYVHPMPSNTAINIDMATGKRLTIADALDPAHLKPLIFYCDGQLDAYIAPDQEGADIRRDNVDNAVGNLDFWTFGKAAVTVTYTEYGLDTPATCVIAYDLLRPALKAGFPLPQ